MKENFKYRDYYITIQYSKEDNVFYGKIENIKDLISFEGNSIKQVKINFKKAVDNYLMNKNKI